MSKKKRFVLKIASLLVVYAMAIPTNSSFWVLGEPKLPRKLDK